MTLSGFRNKMVYSIILKIIVFVAYKEVFACGKAVNLDKISNPNPPSGPSFQATNNVEKSEPLRIEDISYQTYGERSREALVLIHGLGSDSSTFNSIIAPLSKNYFVITFDQRGHGLTTDLGLDYSPDLLAKDMAVLLDSLNVHQAHFLGHSFGARTALKFSELYPERVKSIIVEDMDMMSRWGSSPSTKQHFIKKAVEKRVPREYSSKEEIISVITPIVGAETANFCAEGAVDHEGKWKLTYLPHVSDLYNYYSNSSNLGSALEKVTFPILFLRADPRGSGMSEEGITHLREHLTAAQIVTVPGAHHDIHNSKTKEFLSQLARSGFLKP